MKFKTYFYYLSILVAYLLLTNIPPALASSESPPLLKLPILIPSPPHMIPNTYLLMDADSGQILVEKNAHKPLPPASLTKIMSLYVISSALKQGQIHLHDKVTISKNAWKTPGSRMFLKLGSKVEVKKLIKGIIVDSGNDACVAMAEHTAGSESSFVNLMNQTAISMSLMHTHFVSSTGLPHKKHLSTAYDLAHLAQALIHDFPEDYAWYKQKKFTFNNIPQINRNRLLWHDPSVDGIKTGHTKAAGFCLVASAKRHNQRLISVVMGAPSDTVRHTASQSLLNYGFRFYKTHLYGEKGKPLAQARVWFGKKSAIHLGLKDKLYVTTPIGQFKKIQAKITLNTPLKAPIILGKNYGYLTLSLGEKTLQTIPLVALEASEPSGWFWKHIDEIHLLLHRWFS